MSDVEFDIDKQVGSQYAQYRSRAVLGQPEVPKMAEWLVKKGIVKKDTQAKVILLTIIIINFLVTGFIFMAFSR